MLRPAGEKSLFRQTDLPRQPVPAALCGRPVPRGRCRWRIVQPTMRQYPSGGSISVPGAPSVFRAVATDYVSGYVTEDALPTHEAYIMESMADGLKRVAGKQTLTLTHYGRKSGKPYKVTIWFTFDG